MVDKRKVQEAQTFLNKKGKIYAINIASNDERKHFEGILYNDGIPSFYLINYPFCSFNSLKLAK